MICISDLVLVTGSTIQELLRQREYGLRRTRLKGRQGAAIWVGFGVLAHNLDRMVALS
jgi:hypothetical protein